jgi:hypothetical protein
MANCGNTGVIPDCLEAQSGEWKITYNVPEAPYVRYRYPNGNWQTVSLGTRFESIQNSPNPGQGVGVRYRVGVYVECTMRAPRTVNDCPGQLIKTVWQANRRADVIGPITSISVSVINTRNICTNLSGFGTRVRFNVIGLNNINYAMDNVVDNFRATQPTNFIECTSNDWEGQRFYYDFNAVRSFIERFDGQPENNQETCTFKVFDADNREIYTETRNVCPEAEAIACQLNPENEQTITISPNQIFNNQFLKGLIVNSIFTLEGQKGTRVEITLYPFPNFPSARQTILELYSPKGCNLHPLVCWECDGCKDKCPENTCLKVLNRATNKICCYGKNGKVIAMADPKCETPDC